MQKSLINPNSIVTPLNKFSHAIRVDVGNTIFVYVAGQSPVDLSGGLIGEGDITKQTEFVFEEIKTILEAAGASLADVVKATLYVTDMSQFAKVSEVRNRYFADNPPASTSVEVNKLVQEGAMVEIDVVAVFQQ